MPSLWTEIVQTKPLNCSVKVHPIGTAFTLVRFRQIEVVCFMVVERTTLVHIIQSVRGIVFGERRNAGSNVRQSNGHICLTRRVEEAVLVTVRVSVILSQYGIIKAVNDSQKIVQPSLSAFPIVGRNVANDVNFIARQLSFVQFLAEPLELISRIYWIVQRPWIQSGTVVGVDANNAKFVPRFDCVVATTAIKTNK